MSLLLVPMASSSLHVCGAATSMLVLSLLLGMTVPAAAQALSSAVRTGSGETQNLHEELCAEGSAPAPRAERCDEAAALAAEASRALMQSRYPVARYYNRQAYCICQSDPLYLFLYAESVNALQRNTEACALYQYILAHYDHADIQFLPRLISREDITCNLSSRIALTIHSDHQCTNPRIFIDDIEYHEENHFSTTIPIDMGDHQLRIECVDFENWEREVHVRAGQTLPIDARLRRSPPPPTPIGEDPVFWTIVSVGLAAAIAGTVYAAHEAPPGPPLNIENPAFRVDLPGM